jgi:tetratricopeptide (TPR) repeat protein
MFRRAEAIYRQSLEPDDSRLAKATIRLGRFYLAEGRLAEAETVYREALARYERRLGRSHTKVPVMLIYLAELYLVRDETAAAEPLLERAHAIFDQALPEAAEAEAPLIGRFSRPE